MLSGWIWRRRQGSAVLIRDVEVARSVFGKVLATTGMVLSFFWEGGLPPYYAPGISILNSGGRFDQKTTSFNSNVPNMNFFSEVPNQKS